MLYLTMEYDDIGLNILTFLPQLIIILALVYRKAAYSHFNFPSYTSYFRIEI